MDVKGFAGPDGPREGHVHAIRPDLHTLLCPRLDVPVGVKKSQIIHSVVSLGLATYVIHGYDNREAEVIEGLRGRLAQDHPHQSKSSPRPGGEDGPDVYGRVVRALAGIAEDLVTLLSYIGVLGVLVFFLILAAGLWGEICRWARLRRRCRYRVLVDAPPVPGHLVWVVSPDGRRFVFLDDDGIGPKRGDRVYIAEEELLTPVDDLSPGDYAMLDGGLCVGSDDSGLHFGDPVSPTD